MSATIQFLQLAEKPTNSNFRVSLMSRFATLFKKSAVIRETAVLAIGNFGRISFGEDLGAVLGLLVEQLGSSSSPLRSLAFAEVCPSMSNMSDKY